MCLAIRRSGGYNYRKAQRGFLNVGSCSINVIGKFRNMGEPLFKEHMSKYSFIHNDFTQEHRRSVCDPVVECTYLNKDIAMKNRIKGSKEWEERKHETGFFYFYNQGNEKTIINPLEGSSD